MTYFRERLWPSIWVYLALALVIPASVLVFLQIELVVGILTGVAIYLGCAGLLSVTAPVVQVTDTQLLAGRAELPLEFVGRISTHDGREASLELGQRLDARTWLLIRGWITPIVKIEITDTADATPYWIVSTRRPTEFTDAVATARSNATR